MNKYNQIGVVIIGLISLVGIVVRAHVQILDPLTSKLFFKEVQVDLFSFYKAWYLVLLVATLLLVFITLPKKEKLSRLRKIDYSVPIVMAMFVLVVLSTLFSEYKSYALWGFVDRYEGVFVWSAYLLLAVLIPLFIREVRQIEGAFVYLVIAAVTIFTVGLFQYLGYDFIKQEWARFLILPLDKIANFGDMQIETTSVYATLYNPNFVGGFVAILVPIFLYIFLKSTDKKMLAISSIGLVLSMVNLAGSKSNAGFLGVGASLFFGFVLLMIKKPVKVKKTMQAYGILLITLLALFILDPALKYEFGYPRETEVASAVSSVTPRYIEDIKETDEGVEVTTDRDKVSVINNAGNIRILDEKGNDLAVTQVEGSNVFLPSDDHYSGYEFRFYFDRNLLEIVVDGKQIPILMMKDDITVWGLDGQPLRVGHAESFGFNGLERIGSGRGYIWSRTIPLLKETILLGHGADTYPMYFPQYDIDKLLIVENLFLIVDKPHNTFLQMGLSFGVLFVILYVILVIGTGVYLIRQVLKNGDLLSLIFGLVLFGFNIVSLFNDSVVNVNPYYWWILGMSIAYLRIQGNGRKLLITAQK